MPAKLTNPTLQLIVYYIYTYVHAPAEYALKKKHATNIIIIIQKLERHYQLFLNLIRTVVTSFSCMLLFIQILLLHDLGLYTLYKELKLAVRNSSY